MNMSDKAAGFSSDLFSLSIERNRKAPTSIRRANSFLLKVRLNTRGISTLELALVLPVLVILMFGLVDFGLAFARVGALSDAVNQGARTGVGAREEGVPEPELLHPTAEDGCNSKDCSCKAEPPRSRRCAGVKATRSALAAANIPVDDWYVLGTVTSNVDEDSFRGDLLTIRVDRKPGTRWCIFCLGSLIEGDRTAQATYVLETDS